MTLGIKFSGFVYGVSGYSEFGRGFISALDRLPDISLTVEALAAGDHKPETANHAKALKANDGKKIPYQIKVINTSPPSLPALVEKGCKNVCFTMFETNKLPDSWVKILNKYADAVFVPCSWNLKVFKESGIVKPIFVVPPGIDRKTYEAKNKVALPNEITDLPQSCVLFYSVFQFHERKNPQGLIKAYLSAFEGVKDVCLIIKTYSSGFSLLEQALMKSNISLIASSLTLKKPPKILPITQMLTNDQMIALHKHCDCFVLPHRAEGWGMPHMEAMACGKPVIATGFSGNMEFMSQDNSYPIDYQMTVVSDMQWMPFYEGDMEWAEADLSHLKRTMKMVYHDIKQGRKEKRNNLPAHHKGLLGQKTIFQKFTHETCAKAFIHACRKVIG